MTHTMPSAEEPSSFKGEDTRAMVYSLGLYNEKKNSISFGWA